MTRMIEAYGDGTYKCFKCRKRRPAKSFVHDGSHWGDSRMITGERISDEVFKDSVENGHGWACVECFIASGFMRALKDGEDIKCKPSDQWPDIRFEDLTKCIHCEMYWPFWDYNSYMAWTMDVHGNRMDVTSPEPLHAFIRQKGIIWGCKRCYVHSGLRAIKKEGHMRWRAYKPRGENSWASMAQYYRARGDYQATD
jgi:hypothetical protein